MKLTEFPTEIQEQVKATLTAYDTCSITRTNGKYTVGQGACVTGHYAPDHKVYRFDKNDVYSKKEQLLNYTNSFKSYHSEYEGKKDYNNLQLLSGVDAYINEDYHAVYVNDDIVVVKR
jgi:hypothetical protein